MVNFETIRGRSLATARILGYPTNEHLPLLDDGAVIRSHDEVVDRILGMLCVAACAYGFDNRKAVEWLGREATTQLLTAAEARFLRTKAGDRRAFMEQIEAIWALAWGIGIVPDLDFGKPCAQDFVLRLPDLKEDKSSADFRGIAKLRPHEDIVAACDLAYCIHWAIRESQLAGVKTPGKVETYVIVERRRALEWLLTDVSWEEITLDT